MNTKNAGLVLSELVIVLMIIGVVTSAVILSTDRRRSRLESAMTGLQSDLRYIRKLAMSKSSKTRIVFDVLSDRYTLWQAENGIYVRFKTVNLDGVKFKSVNAGGYTVEYTSRGTTGSACTIIMSAGGYEGSLTVNVGSGRVKIKGIIKR